MPLRYFFFFPQSKREWVVSDRLIERKYICCEGNHQRDVMKAYEVTCTLSPSSGLLKVVASLIHPRETHDLTSRISLITPLKFSRKTSLERAHIV